MTVTTKVRQTITTHHEAVIDATSLLEILRNAGWTMPDNATLAVDVPYGGDFSGQRLEMQDTSGLIVGWTTTSTREE